MVRVLPAHNSKSLAEAVKEAVTLLRSGEVVAIPTETVYGLAANALNPDAVARIFTIKGRPAFNPIIVHVASVDMARACTAAWPDSARKLAQAFWPGPLTLVLPKSAQIPEIVAARGPTVGIRWPAHPVTDAIIRDCGFPLAAPSANVSGQVSPTTAEHVRNSLGGSIPLIIDGGTCQVGIESTVLDLSVDPPRILRPGMVTPAALETVIGAIAGPAPAHSGEPADALSVPSVTGSGHGAETCHLRSPGLLEKHYAPRAKLVLANPADEGALRAALTTAGCKPEMAYLICRERHETAARFDHIDLLPPDPAGFAHALYAALHRADAAGAEVIVLEPLPATPEWQAIADRVRRAAT